MNLKQEQRLAAEQAHEAASSYDEQHGNPRSASENDSSNRLWAEARRLADVADGIVDPTTLPEDTRDATVPLRAPGADKSNVNALNEPDMSDEGIAAYEAPTLAEWKALPPETRILMQEAGIGLPHQRTRRERRKDAKAQERKDQ